MAKLTSRARSNLRTSQFAGPGRSFPVEDAKHARAAELDAPASERRGTITAAQRRQIDARARAVLARGR